ncbi:MAG: SDR family oxidoreductase [Pseudomonadota bacterium]
MINPNALADSLVLVTGASGDLGKHFSKTLSRFGATVVLAARRLDRLQDLQKEIESNGGRALAVSMDVTSRQSVTAAFEVIHETFEAPCDILINNSGIGQKSWFTQTSEEEWSNIVDTNLTGVWRVAQQFSRALISAEKPGSIINIASITGLQPSQMISGYAASKAAVDHLTRNMAIELARSGIRVNAIAPGYFKTAINDEFLDSEPGQRMKKRIAMRRFGEYADLDGPILLLASDAGAYMTGATIVVDGGHTLVPL